MTGTDGADLIRVRRKVFGLHFENESLLLVGELDSSETIVVINLEFLQYRHLVVGHRRVGADAGNGQIERRAEIAGVGVSHLLPVVAKIASGRMVTETALVVFKKRTVWRPSKRRRDLEVTGPRPFLASLVPPIAAEYFIAHRGSSFCLLS
jgi:hypothetical protein